MKIKIEVYKNRAGGDTFILCRGEVGYRLSGIKLLPGDPLKTQCSFEMEDLLRAVPGLRYEPPNEQGEGG